MPIWNYEDLAKPHDEGFSHHLFSRRTCLYCKSLMHDIKGVRGSTQLSWSCDVEVCRCCPICGWWYIEESLERNHTNYYGGFARLKNLDLSDVNAPIKETKAYLLAKYESRFDLNPALFEKAVASIFKDIGYTARVTSYRCDNGVDVYLDGPNHSLIGIQVKRWRGSIKIEQIHALAGALIVNHCTEGVFVTTSRFQKGAKRTANTFGAIAGIPIQLIDASRLYAALKITARAGIPDVDDPTAPWNLTRRKREFIYSSL